MKYNIDYLNKSSKQVLKVNEYMNVKSVQLIHGRVDTGSLSYTCLWTNTRMLMFKTSYKGLHKQLTFFIARHTNAWQAKNKIRHIWCDS